MIQFSTFYPDDHWRILIRSRAKTMPPTALTAPDPIWPPCKGFMNRQPMRLFTVRQNIVQLHNSVCSWLAVLGFDIYVNDKRTLERIAVVALDLHLVNL